jgi:GNAT superfamily N-acetyltransferase
VRVALAPCSPFSVSPGLMRRTAELAERLDVRLHTHLAEDPDEDTFCLERFGRRPVEQFEEVGWLTGRSWVAHCIYPNEAEVARLGAAGVGVAHCPSSNMLIGGGGFAPVREFRAAGVPVGLGCDGSASTDSASLWIESRAALLLGRQRLGPTGMTAREVLDIATRGGAACLGRAGELGELTVGAVGDLVCWPQEGVQYAGALVDPVEAWLRCGPVAARHTIVAGQFLVRDGALTAPGVEEKLRQHAAAAARIQGVLSMITIGTLSEADRPAWEELFRAYNTFYESEYPQSMYDRAWTEFQADERMHALGAWLDGELVGITHFFPHVQTTASDSVYLEDLFTAPEARGRGVGRALINAVGDWAAEHGYGRVYWHTHETNATARLLYDKVATLPGFIMYTMDVPRPTV